VQNSSQNWSRFAASDQSAESCEAWPEAQARRRGLERQVSIRKACAALEFDQPLQVSSLRLGCPRTTDQGACHVRIRHGYRRVLVLLRREGRAVGKTHRLANWARKTQQNARTRVKAKLRDDCRPVTRSNETWAIDFVHDQLATGHKLSVLAICRHLLPASHWRWTLGSPTAARDGAASSKRRGNLS
jgi:putative transposase